MLNIARWKEYNKVHVFEWENNIIDKTLAYLSVIKKLTPIAVITASNDRLILLL